MTQPIKSNKLGLLSKEDVKYVAALARIDVPEDKLEGFTKTLSGIVQYVEQLQKLDVGQC